MGTRGLIGFVAEGKLLVAYNQFDSYPEDLGLKALAFAAQLKKEGPAAIASARARAAQLKVVAEDSEPTEEDVAALAAWTNRDVDRLRESGKPSFYQLLRETQGDPDAILSSGYLIDGRDFGNDSLFCEWGYVIDLDCLTVEVYRGFQKQPPTEGRWCEAEVDPNTFARRAASSGEQWYPIERICAFAFAGLPEPEEFLRQIIGLAYPEETEKV